MTNATAAGAVERVSALDAVRGCAILFVLVFHFGWGQAMSLRDGPVYLLLRATRLWWCGVDLFFVVSGFLIGGILVAQRSATNYYGVFYLRRVCRIVPAFLVLLGLYMAARGWSAAVPALDLGYLFANPMPLTWYLVFVQNFGMARGAGLGPPFLSVTWSLAVEEQFYLLLPLLVRRVPVRALAAVVAALALSAPLVRLAASSYGSHLGLNPQTAALVLLPCRMDALGIGVLASLLWRERRARDWIGAHRLQLWSVFGVLSAGALLFTIASPDATAEPMLNGGGLTWLAALFGVGLLLTLQAADGTDWLSRSAFLRWFGLRCYSLYLFHVPAMAVAHALLRQRPPALDGWLGWTATAAGVLTTLGFAELVYRTVEMPFQALGHRAHYHRAIRERRPEAAMAARD